MSEDTDLPESFRRRHCLTTERWDDFEFLAYHIQMRHMGVDMGGW